MDVVDQAQVSEEVLSEPMDMQIVHVGQVQQPPPTVSDFAGSSTILTRKGKSVVPECAIALRRSARTNKYDGFKVHQVFDSKKKTSKVKPRVVPTTLTIREVDDVEKIPPPTPVRVIQQISAVLCAIPTEELTGEALMASQEEEPPAST
mgnify:CR=1 FL=1